MSKHSDAVTTLPWSEARLDLLRKYWKAGKTASEIAALLGGTTRNAVVGKAHRLGLAGRKSPIKRGVPGVAKPAAPKAAKPAPAPAPKRADFWTPERIAILQEGYSVAGMQSIATIAGRIGCTERRISDKASELGLMHPYRYQNRAGLSAGAAKAVDLTMAERLARRVVQSADDSRNVPLADLDRSQCHFPTSPHMVPAHRHFFCGAPAERLADGTLHRYCAHHHAVTIRPMVSLEERATDNNAARMAAE